MSENPKVNSEFSCLYVCGASFQILYLLSSRPLIKNISLIMTSRRKASTKSRHDRSIADGSSLQYDNFTPKVEFLEHSVDPEEAKAYREAKGEVKPPTPGTWAPLPFRANPVEGCPRRSCPYGLDAIRSFCRVPKSV